MYEHVFFEEGAKTELYHGWVSYLDEGRGMVIYHVDNPKNRLIIHAKRGATGVG